MTRFELVFAPARSQLRGLRLRVDSMVAAGVMDRELACRVSMAATELAENAVKYGVGTGAQVRIELDSARAIIRVESHNEATPENIAEVTRLVAQVNQGDAEQAYQDALLNAALADNMASKVGLARIRCEGRMDLRCEISNHSVRIIAEHALELGSPDAARAA
jgi:hypothetical protein